MSVGREVLLTSVVIAIPISILANILTGPVQRELDRVLKRQSSKKEAERADFRRLVQTFATDQVSFSTFLVVAVLRTTFYGALFGLLSGLAFAVGQASNIRA